MSRLKHTMWALDGSQLAYARGEGIITYLPSVSATELDALNKGDALVKLLAIVQVLWLIIELISRKVAGLPSSQLEIAALAIAACSFITYLLFWSRPQGVKTVMKIPAARFPTTKDLEYLSRNGPRYLWTGPRMFQLRTSPEKDLVPIPNDSLLDVWNIVPYGRDSRIYRLTGGNEEVLSLTIGAIVGGTIFGGLHCLAWRFDFPTRQEMITWRVCSVLITALPILSIPPLSVWARYNGIELDQKRIPSRKRNLLAASLLICFFLPYILSRLFIMVEILRTLFFLPPEAFIETWSNSLPQ